MEVRKWFVSEALDSVRRLNEIMHELSEEEVIAALELESGSRKRPSIIDRLISRAVRLNELTYVTHLKEKYHGTSTIKSPVGSGSKGKENC